MKDQEEFTREVRQKAAAKRAHRKQLLTLAVAVPAVALAVLAVGFGAPMLRGSSSGAAAPQQVTEDAAETAYSGAYSGLYTLEASPARLLDMSWRAWEAKREALYEEAWKDVTGDEDKETLQKLQLGLDEQLARVDEEQKTFRERPSPKGWRG